MEASRNTILLILVFGLFVFVAGEVSAQNPVNYANILQASHLAEFDFHNLDRQVLTKSPATFYAPDPVIIEFEILVAASGKVMYVRSVNSDASLVNFRRGGASALYKFAFEPVDEAVGDKWFKVQMHLDAGQEGY